MITNLAPHLRTLTAAQRGVDTSKAGVAAVRAWMTRSRASMWADTKRADAGDIDPKLDPTYTDWAWILNLIPDAKGATIRVWPSNDHWDSPAYYDAAPGRAAGQSYRIDPKTGLVAPYDVAWGAGFRTGTAPKGVDADLGALMDIDTAGTEGWAILGRRQPNPLEKVALAIRTTPPGRPGLLGFLDRISGRGPVPQFRDGDWVADGLGYQTPANAGKVEGRGAGKVPKRRGVVTFAELQAGAIEHAISVTFMNFNHGGGPCPIGPPVFVDPASRVEHADRPGNAAAAGTFGQAPGLVVPNGQAYAFVWNIGGLSTWLDSRGYTGKLRTTAETFGVAYEVYGWEGVETCAVDPQAEATLTESQWATLGVPNADVCGHLMDGMWDFGHVVALKPSPVGAAR